MDVAGQLHLYGLGPSGAERLQPTGRTAAPDGAPGPSGAFAAAPYDQFWASESAPMMRDAHGGVVDAETEMPLHWLLPGCVCACTWCAWSSCAPRKTGSSARAGHPCPLQHARGAQHPHAIQHAPEHTFNTHPTQPNPTTRSDRVVDYCGDPYGAAFQRAFREGTVMQLPAGDLPGADGCLPSAVAAVPPTVAAAAWQTQEDGGSEAAIAAAVQRALLRASQHDMAAAQRQVEEAMCSACLPTPYTLHLTLY